MGMALTTENSILNLIFRATAWANYADNAAGTPETNILVALQTDDPTDTGTMSTNEVAYTSYARASVARSTGWTVASDGSTSPAAQIDFPTGTGGSGTADWFSTGKSGAGAQPILFSGTVAPAIICGTGVTPHLTVATTITLE